MTNYSTLERGYPRVNARADADIRVRIIKCDNSSNQILKQLDRRAYASSSRDLVTVAIISRRSGATESRKRGRITRQSDPGCDAGWPRNDHGGQQ